MLEVASPLALGGWERRSEEIWPSTWFGPARCMPLDPYASQSVPYIDLQPFRNAIVSRAPDVRSGTNSFRVRSPVRLSVQPAKVKAKQRRRSTPRKKDDSQKRVSHVVEHESDHTELSRSLNPTNGQCSHQNLDAPIPVTHSIDRFADTLFSLVASDGRPYDPTNRCDLCRRPFEAEEDALYEHLSQHLRELDGSFSCKKCKATFSHKGDLKWHEQSSEDGNCASQAAAGWQSRDRLTHWEQAQLQLHSRIIDGLCQARSSRIRPRAVSLPPRKRIPLSISADEETEKTHVDRLLPAADAMDNESSISINGQIQHVHPGSDDASCGRVETVTTQQDSQTQSNAIVVEQSISTTAQAVYSLQQRILDLMETIQPDLAENDDRPTPYSEFCDTHSLPGTPENFQRSQAFERDNRADRATSEPPRRMQECSKEAAPYNGDSERGRTTGTWDLGPSNAGQGQKRGSDRYDPDQWDGDDSNGPLQPKKRKTVTGSTNANEKRFPCIFHIGEPERFAKDLSRHKHISNMW